MKLTYQVTPFYSGYLRLAAAAIVTDKILPASAGEGLLALTSDPSSIEDDQRAYDAANSEGWPSRDESGSRNRGAARCVGGSGRDGCRSVEDPQ
jgi:hypothetical protein